MNTYPGYVIDVTANLHINAPLAHATSCRTTSEMPFRAEWIWTVASPNLPARKGILASRHAQPATITHPDRWIEA